MVKKYLLNKRVFVFVAALSVFAYTLSVVFTDEINKLDSLLMARSDFATAFFKFITRFGDWYVIVGIILLSLIFFRKYFKVIVTNAVFITLVNQALKFLIQRPRPNDFQIISVSGYSFPSGHAMISAAFYGFIFYLIYKSNLSNKYKVLLGMFILILVVLICISRVYLGVHYLTDVIAGSSLAMLYLTVYTYLLKIKKINI